MRVALNTEEISRHEAFFNRLSARIVKDTNALVEARDEVLAFYITITDGAACVKVPIVGAYEPGMFAITPQVLSLFFKYCSEVPSAHLTLNGTLVNVHWDTGSVSFPTVAHHSRTPILATDSVLWEADPEVVSAVLAEFTSVDGSGHQLGDYLWIAPSDSPDTLNIFGGDGTICSSSIIAAPSHGVGKPVPVHHSFVRAMALACSTLKSSDGPFKLSVEALSDGRFFLQAACGARLVRTACPIPRFSHDIFARIFTGVEARAEISAKDLMHACRQFVVAASNVVEVTKDQRLAPGRVTFGNDELVIAARETTIRTPINGADEPKSVTVNVAILERSIRRFPATLHLGLHKGMLAFTGPTDYGTVTTILAAMRDA